jgi:hypothetical protein
MHIAYNHFSAMQRQCLNLRILPRHMQDRKHRYGIARLLHYHHIVRMHHQLQCACHTAPTAGKVGVSEVIDLVVNALFQCVGRIYAVLRNVQDDLVHRPMEAICFNHFKHD